MDAYPCVTATSIAAPDNTEHSDMKAPRRYQMVRMTACMRVFVRGAGVYFGVFL